MKKFTFLIVLIIQIPIFGNAQTTGAAGSAGGASTSSKVMAATSAGAGVVVMVYSCPWDHLMCALGGGLVAAGAVDLAMSHGYKNTGDQITTTSPTTNGPTSTDGAGGPPSLDPYVQGMIDQANTIAAQNGTTVPALAAQAASGDGNSAGGGGDLGGLMSQLSPELKDKIAKKVAEVAAHYKVSAVALEGGGGGGGKNSGGMGLDMAALLNSLKGDRGAASVDGLQKSLNGEPIGVAQDNIFKQITRKYQSKISAQMFLPIKK